MDPDRHRWKNRLLLVFAPSAADADFREQRRLLEGEAAGFEERELLLAELFEEGEGEIEAAARARERFGVEDGRFALVLVGKDGTEKFRSRGPVPAGEVFGRIDAMPVRRREMAERKAGRDAPGAAG